MAGEFELHWQSSPPSVFLGNGPNGQAIPHCGTCSSLRGAFDVLPVAELLVVDASVAPEHQPPAPLRLAAARSPSNCN
jgi:hypothetical protein